MAIDTVARKSATYFVGTEVENTVMRGQKTLFVVGIKPVKDIIAHADKHKIKHIYLGTSQSFTPVNVADWDEWDALVMGLLKLDLHVTLDFDVQHVNNLQEYGWCENNKFIPMISVKIPYIRQLNYNATVKLDDVTWGYSNPGVWCHPLNELLTKSSYTGWHEYVGDTPIKQD